MNSLLTELLHAHGGLDTWRALHGFRGHMAGGGPLFHLVGQPDAITDVSFEGACHEQLISQWPLGGPGRRSVVRPDHATIQNEAGETVLKRSAPRAAFPEDLSKGWDTLNLAYFAGYAMWNYLNAPFLFTLPGVETQELPSVQEDGETLRRLLVRYPETLATHSREETFYVSERGLIVRVDYAPEVTGNRPAANFASEHREVPGGLIMPTRRTVVPRGPDGTADRNNVVLAFDIDRLEYV